MVVVRMMVEVVTPASSRGGDGGGGGGAEHQGGVSPYGGRDVGLGRRYERHSPWAANYWRCYHEAGAGGGQLRDRILFL